MKCTADFFVCVLLFFILFKTSFDSLGALVDAEIICKVYCGYFICPFEWVDGWVGWKELTRSSSASYAVLNVALPFKECHVRTEIFMRFYNAMRSFVLYGARGYINRII